MKYFFCLMLIVLTLASRGQLNCQNWLLIPQNEAYVSIGDLDVPGDQLTVEAVFNKLPPKPGETTLLGDIVSKHISPNDVNYLLRPSRAEITTTNGYFSTPEVCEFEFNKIYHVAMVYDGKKLKFYRNGHLMSQVNVTGNMIQNDWPTRFGYFTYRDMETFVGYINEVRIWRVARTQDQIKQFMGRSLPTPSSQNGLLAYYTFENLINKQGNPRWNGTIGNGARYNQTSTACNFVADSCKNEQQLTDSLIINSYSKVTNLNACENMLQLQNPNSFLTGDTVLLIQMNGAIIDSTNTSNFGKILDYRQAGNYEINIISQKNGNEIVLQNRIEREYDYEGALQLVRVPSYNNFIINKPLTCEPWNGETGGVLAFFAQKATLQADIDISGKGFRRGLPQGKTDVFRDYTDYFYDNYSNYAAEKGEGISNLSQLKNYGRGAAGNGGGGGNSHNGGGGGGGNGGVGGKGGLQFGEFAPLDLGGLGGYSLDYNVQDNKLFMGGAGGMGQGNNLFEYKAGNGGGIGIIVADQFDFNGYSIISNGENAEEPVDPEESTDGMPGGGAGGTFLLDIESFSGMMKVIVRGGKGADNIASEVKHAPGGGGGGGTIALARSNAYNSLDLNGGLAGVQPHFNGDRYGATGGFSGQIVINFKPYISSATHEKNLSSAAISETVTDCNTFLYTGTVVAAQPSALNWTWEFGDGGTATGQNTTHTYQSSGNLITKLTVEDENGCRAVSQIESQPGKLELKADDIIACEQTLVPASISGASSYSWAPATGVSNPASGNPVISVNSPITYTITGKNEFGCTGTTQLAVSVLPKPALSISSDAEICKNNSTPLEATGAGQFSWLPTASLDNPGISNPTATPTVTTTYTVTLTGSNSCTAKDSVTVLVKEEAVFSIMPDTSACNGSVINLHAAGGTEYKWTSSAYMDGENSATPATTVNATALYQVTITDAVCGKTETLSTTVSALPLPVVRASTSNDITCSKPSATLQAQGAVNYYWYPDAGLNSATAQNPIATPSASTTYTVTGVDANGCSNTDSTVVKVNRVADAFYELPNSFTPNDDGMNDCIGVKHWGQVEKLEFQIFNRWGERVFYTNDPAKCWNGRYKGEIQPNDAYVYIISAKTYCEDIQRKGLIYLIR